MIMWSAKDFVDGLPFCWASLLDSISNMSLMATSFTKSGVEGLTPNAEFTPVRSVGDWALADPAINTQAAAARRRSQFMGGAFMVVFESRDAELTRLRSPGSE